MICLKLLFMKEVGNRLLDHAKIQHLLQQIKNQKLRHPLQKMLVSDLSPSSKLNIKIILSLLKNKSIR